MTKPIEWIGDQAGYLRLLDQTKLPGETCYLSCREAEEVWQAIKALSVRGAPAIGIAAAYGVCLAAQAEPGGSPPDANQVLKACDYLATSRPTAVNLFWALDRMRDVARANMPSDSDNLAAALLAEARAIHEEDRVQCEKIGSHGADLLASLPAGAGLLTHCNTGSLATGGAGTAIAVLVELHNRGREPKVFADETRPLLQGSRLTVWELMERGVDTTLITDSMAAQVMREGRVQAVIVGADRIAANGDTANKIGTYPLAIVARHHNVPFYVAAPTSTFDLGLASGEAIPIEQRAVEEVTQLAGLPTAPPNANAYNPAFDVTPAELISGIITEQGVIQPVDQAAVTELVSSSVANG